MLSPAPHLNIKSSLIWSRPAATLSGWYHVLPPCLETINGALMWIYISDWIYVKGYYFSGFFLFRCSVCAKYNNNIMARKLPPKSIINYSQWWSTPHCHPLAHTNTNTQIVFHFHPLQSRSTLARLQPHPLLWNRTTINYNSNLKLKISRNKFLSFPSRMDRVWCVCVSLCCVWHTFITNQGLSPSVYPRDLRNCYQFKQMAGMANGNTENNNNNFSLEP